MKAPLRGQKFETRNEIKTALRNVLRGMSTEWFQEGCKKLLDRWAMCVELEGDYVEK